MYVSYEAWRLGYIYLEYLDIWAVTQIRTAGLKMNHEMDVYKFGHRREVT
jgi:hypothetical protein